MSHARRHDGLGVLVSQIEDVIDVLVLFRIDEPAFRRFVDEQLNLLVCVNLVFLCRVMTSRADDEIGDAVEQPHERIRDLVEEREGAAVANAYFSVEKIAKDLGMSSPTTTCNVVTMKKPTPTQMG